MEYKDYYKILGVDKNATQDDIKKAYRKMAMKYHPDKNPGNSVAEEKFKEVSEAYEIIGKPENRKKYDELGANWKQYEQAGAYANQSGAGRARTGGFGQFMDYDDLFGGAGGFSDFFETFFGGDAFRSRQGGRSDQREWASPGQDYEARLDIDLNQAYFGTAAMFELNGQKIKINIKPGVRNGQILRVRGKGGAGAGGGKRGHLYIKVRVKPDRMFERKGNDLHTRMDVDLYTAILGGKSTLQTMDRTLSVTLPPETKNGHVFRIKGKGMPVYGKKDTYGDLYARVNILIPGNLSEKEKELFRKLKEIRK
ncbi:MAG: J domain-containing protein [Bacteroidales bacterium]